MRCSRLRNLDDAEKSVLIQIDCLDGGSMFNRCHFTCWLPDIDSGRTGIEIIMTARSVEHFLWSDLFVHSCFIETTQLAFYVQNQVFKSRLV